MSLTKVTDDNIVSMESSKLSGSMPAIDGSSLTGIQGVTKNASDPATDTNPSGGVGTLWLNTTSAELYTCTDATTDANVWYNAGGGDGDVQPYSFQGTISGYSSGGHSDANGYFNVIEKFPFTSDANATDVGDLTGARHQPAGHSASTHGYASGGASSGTLINRIDKYAHAASSTATDHGDLSVSRRECAGTQY